MKSIFSFLIIVFAVSCQQGAKPREVTAGTELPSTGNFGKPPEISEAIPVSQLPDIFASSDTVKAIISGNITASCKHSGCWMDLELGNDAELHVTFKDEGFTIPLDAAGKRAVAEGIAVREIIPVETLRNYAREEGKSEAEVTAITQPAWIYKMIASGVFIEE